MRAQFFSHDYAHSKMVWRWDKCSLCKQCCHSPPALAMPEPGAQSRQGLQGWPMQNILGSKKQQDTNTSLISGWQLSASAACFKGHWRVLHWQRGLRSPAKQPPSLHQKIPAMQKQTQLRDGAGFQERLTLYRWENSISKGVRRDRGNGFTVTEMTLEFRTVLFLERRGERDVLKGTKGLWQSSESECIRHWWYKV